MKRTGKKGVCAGRAAEGWMLVRITLLALVTAGTPVAAQKDSSSADTAHVHPAAGTSIVRFAEIDEGVFKGSKPKNDADYRFLRSKNIKYIVDLKFFPLLYRLEKRQAGKYGMVVIAATINASPLAPSEEHVREILCLLRDPRLRPIYFHCSVGRDRTSMIATLYRVYFLGLPPERAWDEMKTLGFKDDWTLRGLKAYLNHHLTEADQRVETRCDKGAGRSR